MSPQPLYRDMHHAAVSPQRPRPGTAPKQRFVAELSQCLFDFVIQLLPTPEEMAVKEDVRKLLERLIRTIEPDSRLLSFGSTANGFSLRNSDMDLCCLIDSGERLSATDLVTMLGDLLERETKFHVKPLPHARIPIVKLSLDPSPGLPLGIACDIGFENRLALENTRLLMCYAMIDPTRVRTMVLFLKVWSKRRKINSPYKGTLSSYGYVLLVIYFLVHVKNPPVLPNLQHMPPLRPIPKDETHIGPYNVWFFDDIELLQQRWKSENMDTVADLLTDFFRYYSRDFLYNTGVASIRAGLLQKDSKGWQNDLSGNRYNDSRERNRLCIEDPFELDFNVARCVTKDGLYTIRGEFMRALRVLQSRPERAIMALAELCEERKDEELVQAPPYVPRYNNIPPQTPYTVGSSSMRPNGAPPPERLSPPTKFQDPSPRVGAEQVANRPPPPEHMAPRRSKWTSPPPPEAPLDDHTSFQNKLDQGLELATAPTAAREIEETGDSSSSDIISDEDRSDAASVTSDDVKSMRSFSEGMSTHPLSFRRNPSWLMHQPPLRPAPAQVDLTFDPPSTFTPPSSRAHLGTPDLPTRTPSPWSRHTRLDGLGLESPSMRGSPQLSQSSGSSPRMRSSRLDHNEPPRMRRFAESDMPSLHNHRGRIVRLDQLEPFPDRLPLDAGLQHAELARRSVSGPSRAFNGITWSTPGAASIPLPPSPDSPRPSEHSTVYYQTSTRSPQPPLVYPRPGSQQSSPNLVSQYHGQHHYFIPSDMYSNHHYPTISPRHSNFQNALDEGARPSVGPETPTHFAVHSHHSHSHSISTITSGPTPPPHVSKFSQNSGPTPCLPSKYSTPSSRKTSRSPQPEDKNVLCSQLPPGSPTSSAGYATSVSRSPSPTTPPRPHIVPSEPVDNKYVPIALASSS